METKVTLFELLVSSGAMIGTIIGAWIHMRINVASLKTEMSYLKKEVEAEKVDNKANYNSLGAKIDSLFTLLSDVKVLIAENKK